MGHSKVLGRVRYQSVCGRGLEVQHWTYHRCERGSYRIVHLPPYQFDKFKHWLPFQRRDQAIEFSGASNSARGYDIRTGDFCSFKGSPKDANKAPGALVFVTSPKSRRFKAFTEHHIIFGQALAPLALYLELPSRALLTLVPGANDQDHVCRIDSLEIQSPIGFDMNRTILLTMERLPDENSWTFSVSSQDNANSSVSVIQAVGKIRLARRDDNELAATVMRLDRRSGYERCQSIFVSEKAEKLQGNQVYRAAYFDYHEAVYRGVKAISSKGDESVGRVVVSADPDISPTNSLYDAAVLDSIMQNVAIFIDVFYKPIQDHAFVCVGIERIITSGTFDIHAGEWLVHSLVILDTEQTIQCDCYVYDERSQELVLSLLGFHYKRIPVLSWQRSMQKANEAKDANNFEAAQTIKVTASRC